MKKLFFILFLLFILALPSESQTNRILFEGCTGTWCQWCPCGHEVLANLMISYPQIIPVEYHGPQGYGDPFDSFNGNEILSLLAYTAYPRAAIGRREGNLNRAYWQGAVQNQVNLQPPINLSFTSSYNSSTRQLTVDASATALRNVDTTVKINLVITESNLIANQTSNSSCPPGGPNYVHKYVCRSMVNGALGEDLSTGTWTQGITKNKSWTTTINSGWNAANCEVIVFAYFGIGGLLNSQCYVLQTTKDYVITGVTNSGEILTGFSLSQNYPNPFNPNTNIKFTVPKDGIVTLRVFDMLGNEVCTIWNDFLKAGAYNGGFNGSNLASGVYFCRLTAGEYTDTKKMTLVK
jgi:hypothetical protein